MNNYPDDVNEGMIPGCTKRDKAADRAEELIDMVALCEASELFCDHACVLRSDPEFFCGCRLRITDVNNDDVIVLGKGDPYDCPFYENEINRLTDEILEGPTGED
jgi:hypothetical protein